MKHISCILSLIVFAPGTAQGKLSRKAETIFKKAMLEINSRHAIWIKSAAKKIHEKNMSDTDAKNMVSEYGALGDMNKSDIEALIFLVIMQASKNADQDLEEIMSKMKSINEQKKQLRNLQRELKKDKEDISKESLDSIKLEQINQPTFSRGNKGIVAKPLKIVPTNITRKKHLTKVSQEVTKVEISQSEKCIKDQLESLSELDDTQSLLLQMAMDRRSKMMSTISNLLKKISDTSSGIIQNLK